jgi:hypothetical protein
MWHGPPAQTSNLTARGRLAATFALAVAAVLAAGVVTPASALMQIDFEQPFYVHEGWQVWDFCLVENNGLYVLFYGAVPMSDTNPSASDDIWRTTSSDLVHWSPPISVLSVVDATWESRALWAPDVVHDEATGLWWMAYTGVDELRNQRLGMAYSGNLTSWSRSPLSPIQEPSPPTFFYYPAGGWSECRDPYLFWQDGAWRLLSTVRVPGDHPEGHGALAIATAQTMHAWSEPTVFLESGSATPEASLESSQYHVREGEHHLFLHEYATAGITHLATDDPAAWDFATRTSIDGGIAPEVDSFDDGSSWLLSRVAPYQEPDLDAFSFVVRVDTLAFPDDGEAPVVVRSPPLAREFAEFSGNSVVGNPCFGDNPARRGEPPVGHVGNCYFGSAEYFQGPLSGAGSPGLQVGNVATGELTSYPFVIAGSSISLLVGGSDHPDDCYVALVDAATDTVILKEHGGGHETMTERWWDVSGLYGREVYVRIVDSSQQGHINVDHIRETMIALEAPGTDPAASVLVDHGPHPNPCNPTTTFRFAAPGTATCRAAVYDLRGRLVWRSEPVTIDGGVGAVTWRGEDRRGTRAAAGVYVYRLTSDQGHAASGKVTLAP